ncbi:MAG: hypothetical protein JOY54_11025 [Acidobacteriaceae bacterium]|nr:hypothetical protein [Acidobacteriaceae bacterium]
MPIPLRPAVTKNVLAIRRSILSDGQAGLKPHERTTLRAYSVEFLISADIFVKEDMVIYTSKQKALETARKMIQDPLWLAQY